MAFQQIFLLLFVNFGLISCQDVIGQDYRFAQSPMETQLNLQSISMNFPGLYDDVFAGIEGRIAGGVNADENQFPYQALMYMNDNKNATYICGGSLIKYNYVLTAAHCLYDFHSIAVFLGTTNRIVGPSSWSQDITDTSHLIMHPNYSTTGHRNDIALVYLSTMTADILDKSNVALITLPTRDEANVNLIGMSATVSGFGSTADTIKASEFLKYVSMPIIPNTECQRTFGNFIRETNICMSGKGARSVCSGDSGGPMTVEMLPGLTVQVGITSFGHKHGCTLGHPGVFTRVSSYLNWIEAHVGKLESRETFTETNTQSNNRTNNTTDGNNHAFDCSPVMKFIFILVVIVQIYLN